jgi:catechol 2,3-dioxygenase-like lactoylglutathione lyase family enzyme
MAHFRAGYSLEMTTRGFGHLYIETHDWAQAVAFWQALGYELEFETDHHSGSLRHPAGGPSVFLAEQSLEDPLATELYLEADTDVQVPPGVIVVSPFRDTHWGTKVMIIQDPDGHRFRVEAPAG